MIQKRSIAETPYPSLNRCWVKGRGFPFGKRIDGLSVNTSDPQDRYKYNGKACPELSRRELDSENDLNWLGYGARYYDPELGRWPNADPVGEFWSGYLYAKNNPIMYIDKIGESSFKFDGATYTITLYGKNGLVLYQARAHNNVVDGKSKWQDGIYKVLDKEKPHLHGNKRDKQGRLLDSKNSSYGTHGIFRAEPFTDSNLDTKTGMGVHAGRAQWDFLKRYTLGCIRVENDLAFSIFAWFISYDPLEDIEVTNNLPAGEVTIGEIEILYWVNPDTGEPEIWE